MAVQNWREVELTLTADREYVSPYTSVDVWAVFTHETGLALRRPAFWDGGRTWKVRFAAPGSGHWTWHSFCPLDDAGLAAQSGEFTSQSDPLINHRFYQHGFWHMSPGKRSLVHADGAPAILAADTAWALPWRATENECRVYAADRHTKGFNAVLLMSVQPDMRATGPRIRNADEGFDVGFEDLPDGHINQLNPAYFQYLDLLLGILIEYELVPVLQPVFQGFGWKGLDVAGNVVPLNEYARYCRYLVARYGARPVIYLVGADGSGYDQQVPFGGEEIERWDAYQQPTGVHYRPHADNHAWQAEPWLDFQWCQTGHQGEHVPERVMDMWRNTPVKAVANGEPTYENTGMPARGVGWWQGHEAWSNLCAGGTMGVVYGAASLWQWRLHPNEPGHAPRFLAEGAGWREALDFEGSHYIGLLAQILNGLPMTDIAPDWQVSVGRRGLLSPGKLYIAYTERGGPLSIVSGEQVPLRFRVIDPRTGSVIKEGIRASVNEAIPDQGEGPRVYICCDEF